MFLQRTTVRDGSRKLSGSALVSDRSDHSGDGTTSSRRASYACQRSYPPTLPTPIMSCGRASLATSETDTNLSGSSPSRKAFLSRSPPPSPVATSAGVSATGRSSCGVFLQNCQASGDFLQLRSDGVTESSPVRLYLTAAELVKKASVNGSSRAPAPVADRDFTISRYRLQDVRVSASKVSPATLVVSLLQNPPSDASTESSVGVMDDPSSVTATKTTAFSGSVSNGGVIGTTQPNGAATRPILVEAYRLREHNAKSAAKGVREWISNIEKNRRKLEMRERLRHTSAANNTSNSPHTTNSTTTVELSSLSLPLSPTRPSALSSKTAATTSSPGQRCHSRDSGDVLYRRSHLGLPSCDSPTNKLPTTTNGRYTPLHHHYSPHPLFSNPHNDVAAVQLRRRKQAGNRLLRRLSLGGGTSGSYHFPPSPVHTASGGDEIKPTKGRNVNGRTAYMYSLSQDSVPPSGTSLTPSPSDSPSRQFGDSSPQQQATPTNKGGKISSWKRRRSIFSRSISENCDRSLGGAEMDNSTRQAMRPATTTHQTSNPLPNPTATEDVHSWRNGTSNEGSPPPEKEEDRVPFELRTLQSLLISLTSSPSSPPTPLPPSHQQPMSTTDSFPHTPSDDEDAEEEEDDEDEEAGFQSFLRHKQIRGRKVHVSPRAHSSSFSSELLSPPLWMDRFSIPAAPSPSPTAPTGVGGEEGRRKTGNSSTLPRGHKVKADATRTSRTLDRDGSCSPVPKTTSKAPKLFKRFHRRWQSSSGVKLELEMIPTSSSTPDSSQPLLPDLKQPPASLEKLHQLPAREVAEGLTKMDAELLAQITSEEISDGAWMKRGQKEKLAPNILAMVHSFNQLALLVPTEILGERTPQQRSKVIAAYIQIASKCYYLKNFNSLKAILAGLQSTPVYRLRRTWKDIPSRRKKRFNMLCQLMSEDNNWEVYRDKLDGCLASSTPCVPYLGQFLTQVCHQLSYDKMRAEKEEVKLRRRSQSFLVGTADDNRKKVKGRGNFRRRSKSLHRKNGGGGSRGKKSSAGSLSTPVSPAASDDESEISKHDKEGGGGPSRVIKQVGRMEEDTQSLEFSLELDDQELGLPMSQPEPGVMATPDPPDERGDHHSNTLSRPKKRSSQKLIMNFHSTPVKDANGYIRPLCSPLKLTFDECPTNTLDYDEPDFDVPLKESSDINKEVPFHKQHLESSKGEENGNPAFRMKIPSISLQKTSSHSSIDEDWDVYPVTRATTPDVRKISKSRSLESTLGLGLGNQRERNNASDGEWRVNHLSPSHSIPSLDSDSVFSVEEEQREREREREAEGEGEREKEGEAEGERLRERKGESEEKEEREGNKALEFVRRKLQRRLDNSFERSLDSEMSTEDVETATPSNSLTTPSTTTRDISTEAMFSPVSSSSEFYTHSRDQSFSTVESSSVAHETRDTSSSPLETSCVEQNSRRRGEGVASPKHEGGKNRKKKARKRAVHRSKSVTTGPTTYRHKWRWKKAVALTNSNKSPPSTLNNADPFHLLQIYKDRSGDCLTAGSTTRTDFRVILGRFNSNSETRNYELSFEREP